jgi:protein gp37
MRNYFLTRFVPRNAWIGTTVENDKSVGRIKLISGIGIFEKSIHFLSCEPLLSDLGELDLSGIDWVIVGGETGPKARPMKKEWVLNIKHQCEEQGVPFFFKSWGRYGEDGKPCPKDQHDLLDGEKYQAWPKGWEKGE